MRRVAVSNEENRADGHKEIIRKILEEVRRSAVSAEEVSEQRTLENIERIVKSMFEDDGFEG